MTEEQFEELKQTIYDANTSPIQRMCCFLCDHCDTYKERPMRSHCNLHNYDLLDPHEGVCFQYRPFRKGNSSH